MNRLRVLFLVVFAIGGVILAEAADGDYPGKEQIERLKEQARVYRISKIKAQYGSLTEYYEQMNPVPPQIKFLKEGMPDVYSQVPVRRTYLYPAPYEPVVKIPPPLTPYKLYKKPLNPEEPGNIEIS